MNNQVFRKVSLERLSSPEQLDSLMKVTSPKGWFALLAIGLLILAAIYWGVTGQISTRVHTTGVLIKPGGINQIYASSGGQITDLRAAVDELVQRGDVIARINQPELLARISLIKQQLDVANNNSASIPDAKERIAALQKELERVELDYSNASRVVSPYTGRVLEVKANMGDKIASGSSLVTIVLVDDKTKDLEAVMYIPAETGKKVIPGMDVQISPTSVAKEEFGFMLGRVVSVSEFPSSRQGMMITLGNEALVNQLSAKGAAMLEVRVDLTTDSSTVSGYKWSSPQGPPLKVNSGTLISGAITLKKERPITTVIPQIK